MTLITRIFTEPDAAQQENTVPRRSRKSARGLSDRRSDPLRTADRAIQRRRNQLQPILDH